jgi:hypothetical protein
MKTQMLGASLVLALATSPALARHGGFQSGPSRQEPLLRDDKRVGLDQ